MATNQTDLSHFQKYIICEIKKIGRLGGNMIKLEGENYREHYEPYEDILKKECTYIEQEIGTEFLTKLSYDIHRYLCPCGMVKVSIGPAYKIKMEADSCGFK